MCFSSKFWNFLNPIQDWGNGEQKHSPTSFYPVTSTEVRISPQNLKTFWLLVSSLLPYTAVKFQDHTNPKLLSMNQDHSSKNRFFWSSPSKIAVIKILS